MTLKVFGYESPYLEQAQTPEGELCTYCGVRIQGDDAGVIMPLIEGMVSECIWHRRCLLQAIKVDPYPVGTRVRIIEPSMSDCGELGTVMERPDFDGPKGSWWCIRLDKRSGDHLTQRQIKGGQQIIPDSCFEVVD